MTDTIKFMLNGKVCEVKGLPPTMTILQYLRTQKRLTGTKEGCAEGDCGACTVVMGEIQGDKVAYKSINACIVFLPVLDGRHVITVEHLKTLCGGELHPAQKEMVACHASQCGFCTPGFVMSIAALCHNNKNADEQTIQDAIAGNLCRCTGYRPILDAARKSCEYDAKLKTDVGVLKSLQRDKVFCYEASGQKFFSPRTTDELARLLAQHPDATMLAGGTDMGLWVTKMHQTLATVIYTGNISALKKINKTPDALEIGAAVSYSEAFEALAAYDPSLETLLRRLGSTQVRNLGTLGGNIANGSPIGDGMPPLISLGAKIIMTSASGSRTLNLEDYFIAYKKQDRKQGEFLEKIIIPKKPTDVLFRTYKISKRFDQDISAVCAAFALKIENGKISEARIAYGGMAATSKRATGTEKFLTGKIWDEKTASEAMAEIAKDYAPLSDMRASAAYRMKVAQNLLKRFYTETTDDKTRTEVYNYGT